MAIPGLTYKFVLGPETPLIIHSNPFTFERHSIIAALYGLAHESARGGHTKFNLFHGFLFESDWPSTTIEPATKEEFLSALAIGIYYLPNK